LSKDEIEQLRTIFLWRSGESGSRNIKKSSGKMKSYKIQGYNRFSLVFGYAWKERGFAKRFKIL